MGKPNKYMSIAQAKHLEDIYVYFTSDTSEFFDKIKENNLIITNTNDVNDVHPKSAEFLQAVEDYHKAKNLIKEILDNE